MYQNKWTSKKCFKIKFGLQLEYNNYIFSIKNDILLHSVMHSELRICLLEDL